MTAEERRQHRIRLALDHVRRAQQIVDMAYEELDEAGARQLAHAAERQHSRLERFAERLYRALARPKRSSLVAQWIATWRHSGGVQ